MTDIDRLREEYEIRHDAEVAEALIAALGDEIAELTGQNIDLEVWRASAVKRAEQAEAELALRVAREKALREELAEVKRDRDRWEWVATHEPDNQTGLARAELAIRSGNYVEWLLARYQPEEDV